MLNPCEDCLIKSMCEKMCPKVIEFYKNNLKTRSREEVIKKTGFMWEYENGELVMLYQLNPIEINPGNESRPNIRIKAFKRISKVQRIINFIKKGLNYVRIRRTKIL